MTKVFGNYGFGTTRLELSDTPFLPPLTVRAADLIASRIPPGGLVE